MLSISYSRWDVARSNSLIGNVLLALEIGSSSMTRNVSEIFEAIHFTRQDAVNIQTPVINRIFTRK